MLCPCVHCQWTPLLKPCCMLLYNLQVRSRFAAGNGSEDFRPFLSCLRQLGFQLVKQDAKNKMFVVFVLKKHLKVDAATAQGINWPLLKACVYKKR